MTVNLFDPNLTVGMAMNSVTFRMGGFKNAIAP